DGNTTVDGQRARDVRIRQVIEVDYACTGDALRSRTIEIERTGTSIENPRSKIEFAADIRGAVVASEIGSTGHDEVCWRNSAAGVIGPSAIRVYVQIATESGIRAGY